MRAPSSSRSTCAVAGLAALVVLGGCAGVEFERETETSGTFTSWGLAATLLGADLPKGAMLIARENASDANLANMEIQDSFVFPYFGPLDWLLDVFGIRYARISGTWGYAGR